MQFSLLTTVITLAGVVHAGVMPDISPAGPGLAKRQADGCEYKEGSYHGSCMMGQNLFCTDGGPACANDKHGSFDETATRANEDSCLGHEEWQPCTHWQLCCPEATT